MRNPVRRQIPRRGPISSHDFNETVSEFAEVSARLQESVNETKDQLDRRRIDDALSRGAGAGAWAAAKFDEDLKTADALHAALSASTSVQKRFNFFSADDVHYVVDQGGSDEGYPLNRRLRLDTRYGQVSLPFNGLKSLFWTPSTEDAGEVVLPEIQVSIEDLSSSVGSVETNNERNAFDASSLDPYLIRVSYPLDSDVTEAQFNVNVVVPQELSGVANLLTFEPAPELHCNVTSIKYSDSALIGTLEIPGLPTISVNEPLYEVAPQRFFFASIDVLSLQIQLSTKHFVYENGRKVFYLGFREIGLFEVSLDETWSNTGSGVFTNNGILLKLEIPLLSGIAPVATFDEIVGLRTTPQVSFAVGSGGSDTGVRVRIYDDDALSNEIYDSYTDGQISAGSPVTVGSSKTHVWIAIELDRNNLDLVIPVLEGLVMDYTVQ